ncbi:MAG: CHASE3 domain-containing protein, partial [Mucilaginibacter sp.]
MLKFSFRQQVFAGFAVSVFLVLLVGLLSYKSINQLEGDSAKVEHTQKVIQNTTNLLQLLIDAETGMRGFVATNKTSMLDPYYDALPKIKSDIEQLRELIQDNSIQVRRVDSLGTLVNAQLNILKTNIEVRPIQGLDYMVNNNMLANGKHNMDEIRALISHIRNTEDNLLAVRKISSKHAASKAIDTIIVGSTVFLVIIVVLFFYIQSTFERQKKIERAITIANAELEKVLGENKAQNWLLTGTGLMNERIQGQQGERELAGNILTEICNYTKALTGTFYLFNDELQTLDLYASYAFNNPDVLKRTVKISEGWLGQVAKDEQAAVVKGKLNDKLELGSSLIQQEIIESFIVPFFFDKKLLGVIEIAFNNELDNNAKDYILAVADDIGIAVNTAQARTIMHELLSQVQQQAEELEAQQEEMRVTNEELLSKTEMLQASEEEMRVQQEELRNTNAELEEKASLLEEKNQAIEKARKAINLKVLELETTGKYKSEFLANMSHELRTPLNSILVLARILKDNKPSNLSEDQVKYASVIFNAGNDLLTLINDILDLSKIESGKLEMQNDNIKVADVLHDMEMLFAEVARNKKIQYDITTSKNLPKSIFTDKLRVEQVLKNLLSNAFKFTPEGGSITVNAVPGDEEKTISFKIKDTGIGIPADKQKIIFEAFQQADGSTSRKFGGTGLGLSISRELVSLLGGKITVTSEPGTGSEFVLTIPITASTVLKPQEETVPTVETFAPEMQFLKPVVQATRVADRDPLVV